MATRIKRSDQEGNGHWIFDEPLGGKHFGFIYLIRDCETGKGYIGKKQFRGTGKMNKGVESNWQWYASSCKELVAAIKERGKENFEFIALEQYVNRGTLGYAETWSLMHVETPTNRHIWYNLLVNKISWPVKEAITDRHKKRIKDVLEGNAFLTIV